MKASFDKRHLLFNSVIILCCEYAIDIVIQFHEEFSIPISHCHDPEVNPGLPRYRCRQNNNKLGASFLHGHNMKGDKHKCALSLKSEL